MDRITVVLQNLQDGGGDRWPLLAERLRNADVLLLNEARGWQDDDSAMLARAEHDLGMTALRPLPPSRSGYHVAIMYRPDVLGDPLDYNTDFSDQFTHGVAVAAWDVGLPAPLGVCVTHLSPFSPADALAEAQKARWTALRYGPYAIAAADFNAPPLFGPPADVSRMSVLDRASRFRDPADCRIPDTSIAQSFADVGFADSGEILYGQTADERHLARTGRSDRIDRTLVTERLRNAVISGALLDTPAGTADHHGVSRTLDLARAR